MTKKKRGGAHDQRPDEAAGNESRGGLGPMGGMPMVMVPVMMPLTMAEGFGWNGAASGLGASSRRDHGIGGGGGQTGGNSGGPKSGLGYAEPSYRKRKTRYVVTIEEIGPPEEVAQASQSLGYKHS